MKDLKIEMTEITIRELQKDDLLRGFLTTLDSLRQTSDIDKYKAERIFEKINDNPDHIIVVAEVDLKIVGSATLLIESKFIHDGGLVGHIEDVVVDKNIQRQRIGEKIMKYLLEFAQVFEADPKILQFISIGAAPAGVLAGVAFIMSKHYGSKPIGGLIIAGGIIMLLGMAFCYSLLEEIEDVYLTDAVLYMPILFMVLSIPVVSFGIYLIKHKKTRPKKQYF